MNDLISSPQPGALATTSLEQSARLLQVISDAALNPAVDVAKMSALLDMHERIVARQSEAEFNRDYAALQLEMPRIKKDGTVEYEDKKTQKKSKAFEYARWESIDDVIRPLLNKYGFSLSFDTEPRPGDGGGIIVTGRLLHRGGHSKSASIPLALENGGGKNNVQGMGSSFSYGKRYTAVMLLNIVFEGQDDDGVAGGRRFISSEQQQELADMLERTNTQPGQFLEKYFEVHELHELEVAQYAPARAMLQQKIDAIAKRAGGGQ